MTITTTRTSTTLYATARHGSTVSDLSIVASFTTVPASDLVSAIQYYGSSLSSASSSLAYHHTLAYINTGVGSAALGLSFLILLPGLIIAWVLLNKRLRKLQQLEAQVAALSQRLAASSASIDQKADLGAVPHLANNSH